MMTLEDFKRFYLDQPNVLIPTQDEMLDYVDGWIEERAQLQARVAELELALDHAIGTLKDTDSFGCETVAAECLEVFNRHPRQSLAAIEAQWMARLITSIPREEKWGSTVVYMSELLKELDRIEQQAEGEGDGAL